MSKTTTQDLYDACMRDEFPPFPTVMDFLGAVLATTRLNILFLVFINV